MLKSLPQNKTLNIIETNPDEAISYINNFIENHSCKTMSIDISFMNIIDACHVSTICSTKHYVKYPDGKIKWKISSELIKEFNSRLELGNADYELY